MGESLDIKVIKQRYINLAVNYKQDDGLRVSKTMILYIHLHAVYNFLVLDTA